MALAAITSTAFPASGQFITVHGGPTYTSGVGGFKVGSFGPFDGLYGAGSSNKYDAAGTQRGYLPFRVHWDGASAQMQVTELDVLGTDASGVGIGGATGVDGAGNVFGHAVKYDGAGVDKGVRAVRWNASGTAATELGHLGTDALGVTLSGATAINSAGTAVGTASKYDAAGVYQGQRTVRWDPSGTAATELGNLGTDTFGVTRSHAVAINRAGVAFGYADKYDAAGVYQGTRAVRWDPTGTAVSELGNLSADSLGSIATAINSAGVALGKDSDERVIRWDASGVATELQIPNEAPFELGYPWRDPVAINDGGMVVGRVSGDFYTISVRWDAAGNATELMDLGMRGGAWVQDINNAGIAVGQSGEPSMSFYVYSAVYWGLDGVAVDLNSLIDPASGWTLTEARFISDAGWITGLGYFDPDGPGGQAAYERPFFMHIPALSAGLPGDFNQDGTIDAADFVLWRDQNGTQGGYNTWRDHFGQTVGTGSFANRAVPEPASLALLVVGVVVLLASHGRRN